ncbi:EAL domain-containing protein [Labrenzia sp. PHM005]|uniref:EAL domain-containing protein n=1 Tax=Labrenzia sp. PHM005 TaxID=2590016 RepID=UPI0011400EDA|nr:EAL domain-containing protein [Labrenzia sp. PHM005]QDG78976.1 EAL domain-containing protein [Labrenzia sp. PHM005]
MVRSFHTRARIGLIIHLAWAFGFVALVFFYLTFSMLLHDISELRQDEKVIGELYFNFPSQDVLVGAEVENASKDISSIWLITFYHLNKNHEKLYGIIGGSGFVEISMELNGIEQRIKNVFNEVDNEINIETFARDVRMSLVRVREVLRKGYLDIQREIEGLEDHVHALFNILIGSFCIWTIAGGLLAKELILRPLKEIGGDIKQLGVDLSRRLPNKGNGELGRFCLEVNRMASDLERTHASRTELEKEILLRMSLEEKVSAFFDQDISFHMIIKSDGQVVRVNKALQQLLFDEEAGSSGLDIYDYVHRNDTEKLRDALIEIGKKPGGLRVDIRFRASNGLFRLLSCALNLSADANTVYFAALDITDREEVEENLRLSASVFTSAMEGIVITDRSGTIINVNNAFSVITGYSPDEIIGKNPRVLQSGLQDKNFYKEMWSCIAEQGFWRGEMWNKRKNGEVYPELLTISAVRDERGEPSHYIGMFSDISRLKQHETKLQQLAHFDALTGLPNRVLLTERIREKLRWAKRTGARVAVGFIDLDDFKGINEIHGHETGDQLLVAVAERLAGDLRDNDVLARIGGDEFVVVLGEVDDEDEVDIVFDRLLNKFQEPFKLIDAVVSTTASIGIANFDRRNEIDSGLLLRRADMAMYRAKLFGRNCCFHFDPQEDTEIQRNSAMIREVGNALINGEFILNYQPKIDLRTGEIIDVEALIRWQKPDGKIIMPGDFLPLVEDDDVIIKIGERVIELAFKQLASWDKQEVPYGVSVNIAARQLQSPDFARQFEKLVANQPVELIEKLEIEILETTAINAPEVVIQQMQRLIDLGVTFSLDDFGTGYSSLTYLRELPVSKIKIDQGFIQRILKNQSDQKILHGTISLGKSFGLDVVAEGMETDAHGYWLLEHGCYLAQGYAISKPLPEAEFMRWRAAWMSDNPWKTPYKQASSS